MCFLNCRDISLRLFVSSRNKKTYLTCIWGCFQIKPFKQFISILSVGDRQLKRKVIKEFSRMFLLALWKIQRKKPLHSTQLPGQMRGTWCLAPRSIRWIMKRSTWQNLYNTLWLFIFKIVQTHRAIYRREVLLQVLGERMHTPASLNTIENLTSLFSYDNQWSDDPQEAQPGHYQSTAF